MKSPCISAGLFLFFAVSIVNGQMCPGSLNAINLFGPVTGAPFTADYIHVLEGLNRDGTRNHQETHGKLYRDSEGRARCDRENGKTGKTKFVIISDPVANVFISIDLERQIANVTHYPHSSSPLALSAPRQNEGTTSPETLGLQGTNTQEDLGSKEFDGWTATGRRYIHVTNTGKTSATEEWYSPTLKFQLLFISEDQSSVRWRDQLNNILAGNPDPSVFQPPEGLIVKDWYCHGDFCGFDSE